MILPLQIAGIGITLAAGASAGGFEADPGYGAFRGDGSRPADIRLHVSHREPPGNEGAELVFDPGGNWQLWRDAARYLVELRSPVMTPRLYRTLELDRQLISGTVFSRRRFRGNFPLQYPLDEILMVNLLARGRGVELHALGVDVAGQGIIFSGTSGAGKSTLARLWQQRQATILSDDRLIVRPDTAGNGDGGFLLYGTPWHGDAGVSAYGGVPLRRVLILSQGRENRLTALSASEAASLLLVRCFPTFWDPEGMRFTMDLLARVCLHIPCFRLEFLPEDGALDAALAGLEQ